MNADDVNVQIAAYSGSMKSANIRVRVGMLVLRLCEFVEIKLFVITAAFGVS